MALGPGGSGTGCQQRILDVCGADVWTNKTACLACVDENIKKLQPNCTKAHAELKCEQKAPPTPGQPTPAPVPTPAPAPTPPLPGSPQPHIILYVFTRIVIVLLYECMKPHHLIFWISDLSRMIKGGLTWGFTTRAMSRRQIWTPSLLLELTWTGITCTVGVLLLALLS